MNVKPIRTRVFHPGEDLSAFIVSSVPRETVREEMIVAVTSKIVSLAENCVVARSEVTDKKSLVRAESDQFLGEIGHGCFLTVKHGLMIPSAGIDESNSESGGYILFPRDPFASAQKLWSALKTAWGVKALGVLLTDSHTSPLRRGVTGIGLSYWGFEGIRNLVGSPDLFGRELKMTRMNLTDGLAAAAVLMMGEGNERMPVAVITGAPVRFVDHTDKSELQIPLEEDLYYPLFRTLT
jgi:F420-0:gamma-glutamyl ligase